MNSQGTYSLTDIFDEQQAYRYVAVADVLGFRALTRCISLYSLVKRFRALLVSFSVGVHMNSSFVPLGGADTDLVRMVVFSDTVLVYTLPISPIQEMGNIGLVSCFFDVCANLIAFSIKLDMPIRMGNSIWSDVY